MMPKMGTSFGKERQTGTVASNVTFITGAVSSLRPPVLRPTYKRSRGFTSNISSHKSTNLQSQVHPYFVGLYLGKYRSHIVISRKSDKICADNGAKTVVGARILLPLSYLHCLEPIPASLNPPSSRRQSFGSSSPATFL